LAANARIAIRERLDRLLGDNNVICLPTSPDIAPLLDASLAELNDFRARAIRLQSPAGFAGLPQVSLPLASLDGCPLGLSLIAPRGRDMALLALAARIVTGVTD
jgi:amidase